MSNNPQIYHGEWWVPAVADRDTRMMFLQPEGMMGHERKYTGTLTYYGDKSSSLELYHTPSNFHSRHYHQNDVIWGKDANGHIFTLFHVMMNEQQLGDFSCSKFVVDMILMGEHVLSLDYDKYSRCIVNYSHLVNWTFYETQNVVNAYYHHQDKFFYLTIPFQTINIFEAPVDKASKWILNQNNSIGNDIRGYQITPSPYFEIRAIEPIPLKSFIRQIKEFTQFLSIALFGIQDPQNVEFVVEGDNNTRKLLFKKETSYDPGFRSVIKLKELKERLPSMLQLWHSNFEEVAPISHYLINSLKNNNRFDVPDFLIIAQALDGYHKRFVNHKKQRASLKEEVKEHLKKGRDKSSQYEKNINILISQFNDVNCIQKCHIDPQVLAQSRDKYSHLLTDEDKPLAVEGEDLYWLTEKCKILLTCCILNMLGLTNKEINLCCENSPISQIMDSLPQEFD
ncbi:MAG: hypothetical protein J5953_05690 [Prevotella sp.]|nr:hypothetical protein [Prevotella sp.]MBO6254703.1 hypothetical protein [Bacteroidaceae bacterium]